MQSQRCAQAVCVQLAVRRNRVCRAEIWSTLARTVAIECAAHAASLTLFVWINHAIAACGAVCATFGSASFAVINPQVVFHGERCLPDARVEGRKHIDRRAASGAGGTWHHDSDFFEEMASQIFCRILVQANKAGIFSRIGEPQAEIALGHVRSGRFFDTVGGNGICWNETIFACAVGSALNTADLALFASIDDAIATSRHLLLNAVFCHGIGGNKSLLAHAVCAAADAANLALLASVNHAIATVRNAVHFWLLLWFVSFLAHAVCVTANTADLALLISVDDTVATQRDERAVLGHRHGRDISILALALCIASDAAELALFTVIESTIAACGDGRTIETNRIRWHVTSLARAIGSTTDSTDFALLLTVYVAIAAEIGWDAIEGSWGRRSVTRKTQAIGSAASATEFALLAIIHEAVATEWRDGPSAGIGCVPGHERGDAAERRRAIHHDPNEFWIVAAEIPR